MPTPTSEQALEALNNLYSAATEHGWRESPATSFATVTAFIESSGAALDAIAWEACDAIQTDSKDRDDWVDDMHTIAKLVDAARSMPPQKKG